MPGKGRGRGEQVGSAGLGTLTAGPCPWFPPPYEEEMGMLVFKSPSFRYILTCWVLFFTLNKTIIKQVTCECCRKIRKYISVPDDTPQATSATPPPLLEHTR